MKKKISLTTVLLLIGFVPLILSSVLISVVVAKTVTNQLETGVYQKLYVASDGLRQYYQNDLDNGNEIPYEHTYVDMLKSEGIELTVFTGDTRLMTSALNDKGERNEGTQMAADIWAKVQQGQDVKASGVNIGGQDYYVYYLPMKADGRVVGASWAGQSQADVNSSIKKVITLLVSIVVAFIIVFALLIYFVAVKVIKSIKGVIDNVEQLSVGNLTVETTEQSFIKEIYALGNNVSGLVSKLREIVGASKSASSDTGEMSKELSETIVQISENSDVVSTAVKEISDGVTEQAEAIQKVTENVGTLSDAIQIVSENAESLAGSAVEMQDASNKSADSLTNLVSKMDEMDRAVKDIAFAMENTNAAVNSVNEKVDGINSIATQTNLLALNASIEAARAGEAGRGFTVVAEEIGKLAKESAKTAEEIKEEMSQLLSHAKGAGEKTSEITVIGSDVKTVLSDTSEMIHGLLDNVSSTVDGVNNISGLTEECNASKEEIVDAMSSLSAVSEENAASTQETEASMSDLNGTVTGLKESANNLSAVAEKLDSELQFFTL